MIKTKQQLKEFLLQDAKANRRKSIKAKFFGDECWKFIVIMRKLDYFTNKAKTNKLFLPLKIIYKVKYHNISIKLGFNIPFGNIDKGFSISHYGTITVNINSKIGKNCRIHEGVNIGATSGSKNAPVIGDSVFIGSGAKIIGDIEVADGVCIGANAVVVKSITESNTTWGGVPAKKISDKSSRSSLSPLLFE